MLTTLFWFLLFTGAAITLAYRRESLKRSTLIMGGLLLAYTLFGSGWALWLLLLWLIFLGMLLLNFDDFRRDTVSRRLLAIYRQMLPSMSKTEREALEAGTVWWEGDLFSGSPDWEKLHQVPAPRLTREEQAFLDGPTETLCRMLDDWQITHELADMPPEVWAYIRQEKFFAMIIPKRYGGLEFSALAQSRVLSKLASRSLVAASTVGVPNSLGPGELLLHYGTEAQKDYYLPRLAAGDEIPCFALTSPRVGSDATAITDTGVVCRGEYEGQEIIGIRLNWDKRYITLAPIATVLGLAFKLYDPDHLMGEQDEYGITAALVPTRLPGIKVGRRHFPLNIPFQNGPTQGEDVFVPLDAIIGGPARAGEGWKMLVEQLSVGRGITLPSNAIGTGKAAVYASGAYARIRRQFGLPVGKFHGVGEVLARMAGRTYIMTAAADVTIGAIDAGEKPAVPAAILKYHNTEMGRAIANDAMDVQGGKGIMLGPKNYLGRNYQGIPIAITVEGANILTRGLIIFGQGAIRCHPYVLKEMEAAGTEGEAGLQAFDRALFGHIGYAIGNAARSLVMALTLARYVTAPTRDDTRRYYQHISRYSASFALAADAAMLTLGGALKRKELLSARLGDVLSAIYLASMVLKHHVNQGSPEEDLPIVEWACRSLLYDAQEQLHGLLRNLPNRWVSALLRLFVFPRGRTYSAPSDELGQQIVELIMKPTGSRERLCQGIYAAVEPNNPLGLLQEALELTESVKPLERKVFNARRQGQFVSEDTPSQINEAEQKGILTADEAEQLRSFDAKVMALIAVDDFSSEELAASKASASAARPKTPAKKRVAKKRVNKKKVAKKVVPKKAVIDREDKQGD
ncbi:acyl-CoA dehydrogenase [Sedimenticola sp.]|uniref:acyl-CoA dehydrogenase n=1 Tax=Sedimenticola sp. TaxID=1940285 RepID=UPI0025832684|nr:acyl-CoA dehydrogenase [Sedimenticola sp.]MCW8904772.1 acyl-CoA dehydrogenase [Sedimenticola sp.]